MSGVTHGDLFPPGASLQHADPQAWPVQDGWRAVVQRFWACSPGRDLMARLQARIDAGATLYPPQPLRALALTAPDQVRVVILGQDPYHGSGQAEGLAFSVARGQRIPPSLRNIHAELHRDLGLAVPRHGSLEAWARRGILLLNTCLTVEDGQPGCHAGWGWEVLTSQLLAHVNAQPGPCAYLLWGAAAQRLSAPIRQRCADSGQPHRVFECHHPSPLSARRPPRPFVGCGHFSQAAGWLADHGQQLDWSL